VGANTLTALNAVTGALIWQSTAVGGTHWQSPILVDGRIYLTDDANPSQLWAFQLDGIFRNGFQ
jgi:outer membrane protein assembly factor BamB